MIIIPNFLIKKFNKILIKQKVFNYYNYYLTINAKNYDNVEKRFFKESLNLSDINSAGSGIFSKDITENSFQISNGNNFQNIFLMNQGVDNYHISWTNNFSFIQLNELFLKKDLWKKNNNPLIFLFWEGTSRREMTGLTVFLGNILFSFGGLSCILGARSSLLWYSLFLGGGRFKKISYISGRSGLVQNQRSFLYEGLRIFYSSNSDKKSSYILNDFFSKINKDSFIYDLHYSLNGLSFINNNSNLKNIKINYFLNFFLTKKNNIIKINNLLLGSLDKKRFFTLKNSIKANKIYFFDSYKMLHKQLNNFNSKSFYILSIPTEYEANALIQTNQGIINISPKVITSKSQVIKSYSLLSNVLINLFFKKYIEKIKILFNFNLNKINSLLIFNQIFELKNRIYSLIESKLFFQNNSIKKIQKISKIYLMSESASPYVNLNICSVDGPSNNSKTMLELNWSLQINNNFN